MCRAKYGLATKPDGTLVFPKDGVGENWTYRFVQSAIKISKCTGPQGWIHLEDVLLILGTIPIT